MTDFGRDQLRQMFLIGYDDLKLRLTKSLGPEVAGDALQDTWIRLEQAAKIGPVRRPGAYIFRIAYNIALKRLRRERGTVTLDDARAALGLVDDMPDAERVIEAWDDMARLRLAIEALTPRRREILFASRLDGISLRALADRYGISQRMVERELKHAVLHCAAKLGRPVIQRFGPRPAKGSIQEMDEQ